MLSVHQIVGSSPLSSARTGQRAHPLLSARQIVGSSTPRAPDSERTLCSARVRQRAHAAAFCYCTGLAPSAAQPSQHSACCDSLLRVHQHTSLRQHQHTSQLSPAHLAALRISTSRCATYQHISLRHASAHLAAPRISTSRCATHQHISSSHCRALARHVIGASTSQLYSRVSPSTPPRAPPVAPTQQVSLGAPHEASCLAAHLVLAPASPPLAACNSRSRPARHLEHFSPRLISDAPFISRHLQHLSPHHDTRTQTSHRHNTSSTSCLVTGP